MTEQAVSASLAAITGMQVYPLALPDKVREGVVFQRISDPLLGMVENSGVVAIRMQVSFVLLDDYSRLLFLDAEVWEVWKKIIHSTLEGQHVQRIEREGLHQDFEDFYVGKIPHRQYRLVRDYIFICPEDEK
ncbi:hypothetical protein S726_002179 [Salmonella enterica subsp. enterica]|nr:hypothetical protein [Salmonella enterica subsp. enterica]EHR6916895.1 hypothetical protein [Salmonella enterica]EHR8817297.1 hypothetical protein [Salmonella enterica]